MWSFMVRVVVRLATLVRTQFFDILIWFKRAAELSVSRSARAG